MAIAQLDIDRIDAMQKIAEKLKAELEKQDANAKIKTQEA